MSETSEYEGKTNEELSELLADRGLPHSGNKADLIERLEADDNADADAPDDAPDDDGDDGDGDDGKSDNNSGRPDGDIVDKTTAEDGGPNNLVKNPIPEDAASGDAVSQVRRGELDGVTITDASDAHDWQPGDVLLSVDPFVTVMRGGAAQELRDNPGRQFKPART